MVTVSNNSLTIASLSARRDPCRDRMIELGLFRLILLKEAKFLKVFHSKCKDDAIKARFSFKNQHQ